MWATDIANKDSVNYYVYIMWATDSANKDSVTNTNNASYWHC